MILSFSFVLYCGILMMMSISGWCIAFEHRVQDGMMEIDGRNCAGYPV